ncbi:hypothetical protein [Streptomyces sp. NPDC002573]|uniref:hypothetical protein n=1 Tax=Streptomyces sp. NPDC002573 TaxID=3364651 RepID=UPI0036ABC82E
MVRKYAAPPASSTGAGPTEATAAPAISPPRGIPAQANESRHGTCRRLTDPDARATAWSAYTACFTLLADDPALTTALARTDLWEVTPTDLRLIDNSRGFGHH